MKEYLVSLDTNRVKEYVFATGRLKEIQGASQLLDWLNRLEIQRFAEIPEYSGKLIFAGGGSAMVKFSDSTRAERFKQVIQARYLEETQTASISGVVTEYEEREPFGDVMKRAAVALRHEKLNGHRVQGLHPEQWMARCQRCGRLPVSCFLRDAEVWVCEACAIRRSESQWQNCASHGALGRLAKAAKQTWTEKDLYDDLGQLAEASRPKGYIGLVYADGNGIGHILQNMLSSTDDLTVFSQLMEDTIVAATAEALKPWLVQPGNKLPFFTIAIGGDDLLLITIAQAALPLAAAICLAFQEGMRAGSAKLKAEDKLKIGEEALLVGMSAGVVLAKASHPLFALREMAGDLLKSAKQFSNDPALKTIASEPVCSLDFRLVTSPSANPWEVVKQEEFKLTSVNERWATCRPYPCEDIPGLDRPSWNNLTEAAHALQGFPHNRLHAWQDLLRVESDVQSELAISLFQSHLRSDEKPRLRDAAKHLRLQDETTLFLRDPLNPARQISPLPDLEEVHEFFLHK